MNANEALLLVNMGGPRNLDEVGSYLRAIFNDPAILQLPTMLRSPLAALIASRRSDKVTERYRLLGGQSPLHHWTAALRNNVETTLLENGSDLQVEYAFRYASPTIEEELTALYNMNVDRVRLLPLFPHFTRAMSGSVTAEAQRVTRQWHMQLEVLPDWGMDARILELWFRYLRHALEEAGPGARVLFVAHGIPLRNVRKGDDYPNRVHATAEALTARLPQGVEASLAFQSRVGPVKWTRPYLEEELSRLCKSRAPLVLMPLSFAADCLETIYDLDLVAAKTAHEAGVQKVVRVRAFNDDPEFAQILAALATDEDHAVIG
jgi:ferrochelatase